MYSWLMATADSQLWQKGKGSVEAIFNADDQFFNQSVQLLAYNIEAVTDRDRLSGSCFGSS